MIVLTILLSLLRVLLVIIACFSYDKPDSIPTLLLILIVLTAMGESR